MFNTYAIGVLLYGTFIDPLIQWTGVIVIPIIAIFTLQFGNILWALYPIYWSATRVSMTAANLWWGNIIYEAFHPVVAPEIVATTADGAMA